LEVTDVHAWVSLYANSAVLRTLVGFAHVAGLLVGGGRAIVADRHTLRAYRRRVERTGELTAIRSAHRDVIGGLLLVSVSGALLLAADTDTYLHSWVFWTKMAFVVLLLANGAALRLLAARASADDTRWRPLAYAAGVSLCLWFLTTLTGAALPNVG
jgi:uncharacterized membrane protein